MLFLGPLDIVELVRVDHKKMEVEKMSQEHHRRHAGVNADLDPARWRSIKLGRDQFDD